MSMTRDRFLLGIVWYERRAKDGLFRPPHRVLLFNTIYDLDPPEPVTEAWWDRVDWASLGDFGSHVDVFASAKPTFAEIDAAAFREIEDGDPSDPSWTEPVSPVTLGGAIVHYCERIEAAAKKRGNHLSHAIALGLLGTPGTAEEENALLSVQKQSRLAQIRVERSTTVDAARLACEAGEALIGSIEALYTPDWYRRTVADGSTTDIGFASEELTVEGTSVILKAAQPILEGDAEVDGEVSIMLGKKRPAADRYTLALAPDASDTDAMTATLTRIGEDEITVELIARNICGPRTLNVTLAPSSE